MDMDGSFFVLLLFPAHCILGIAFESWHSCDQPCLQWLYPYLHLPLALLQRGYQLLVLLQQSLSQLCSENQIRFYASSTVTAAGRGCGRGESEGERDWGRWGEREEGVLQAGGGKTVFPGAEHFWQACRSQLESIIPGPGLVIHIHTGGRWTATTFCKI